MNSLDQLLFTWQRGGFRPVAATGRLAAPSGWLVERARRLCRYDRPPRLGQNEKPPISYGWWTQGDTRWVFRRGYLGADPMGRPGNFFAHIIVGARDALPVVGLAERFASPFWWDGGRLPDDVRPVALPDIPAGPLETVSEEQVSSFLAAVLHGCGARPVVLRVSPAEAVACMAAICRPFPGVFDDLRFSTYEAPQHAEEFHIVGMHATQGPPPSAVVQEGIAPSDVAATVRRLVSSDPKDRHIARILHAAALADGARDGVARLAGFLPSMSSGAAGLTSAARKLRITDRLELLRSAAQAGVDDDVVVALLGGHPPDLLKIADYPELPSAWRGRALAAHLEARPAEPTPVLDRLIRAAVLGQNEELVHEVARALPGARPLLRLLRKQAPATIEGVTVAAIAAMPEWDRTALVTGALQMLEPARRPGLLRSVFKRVRPEDGRWDVIAAAAVTDAVEDALKGNPQRVISPVSKYVLGEARGAESAKLLAVIESLDVAIYEWPRPYAEAGLLRTREALARMDNARRRRVLGELTLAVVPVIKAGPAFIADSVAAIQKLVGLGDGRYADLLLELAVRHTDRSPFAYLAFVIGMVRQGKLGLTRGGVTRRHRLEDRELQDRAARAALRLSSTERIRARELAGPADQPTAKWWLGLPE